MEHLATADWRIEAISSACDRSLFSCGESALDDYLKTKARKFHEQNVSATFVALPAAAAEQRVMGFYTLAQMQLAFEEAPPQMTKRMMKQPLPVILIGRFAVDTSCQGQGLGKILLVDALRTATAVASGIGVVAVVLDAKSDKAKAFYEHHQFQSLPGAPMRLYLGMDSLRARFAAHGGEPRREGHA